jgi:endonuclease V-like protein UPF0215 family
MLTSNKGLLKPATRLLGIAESGVMGASHTILGGVVMRRDLIIDGMIWDRATIRSTDSTEAILRMYKHLARSDINGLMLHGTIIAGFNIIDLTQLSNETALPIISITKEPHEDLKEHLKSTFPSKWVTRWKLVQQNGPSKQIAAEPNSIAYVQFKGCDLEVVKGVIKRFTRFGGIPEPIRVARLFARAKIEAENVKVN